MTPPDAGSAAPLDLDAALSDMRICLAFWKASGEMESRFRSSAFDNWKTVCAEVRRLRDRVTELEQEKGQLDALRRAVVRATNGMSRVSTRDRMNNYDGGYFWRVEREDMEALIALVVVAGQEGGAARRERQP